MPSGRDSPRQALLPHQLCWEQEASAAVQGEAKDEEMPRTLQDRMGVRAADSSSIPGEAEGTRLQSQVVHGRPHKSYTSRALAPPRDHSPSGIPALKSYPVDFKSRDHHSSQGCPWTGCPHHPLPPGYLAGTSAWAAPTAL